VAHVALIAHTHFECLDGVGNGAGIDGLEESQKLRCKVVHSLIAEFRRTQPGREYCRGMISRGLRL